MTNLNKDDLTVINGKNGCTVTGTVKYDPDKTTLTLDGASIDAGNSSCISSEIDNLTIEVINSNTLKNSSGSSTISLYKSGIIQGGGSISATNSYSGGGGTSIIAYKNLTITGCTVTAVGGGDGIVGRLQNNSALTIRNATVTAKGAGRGSIWDFKSITLTGVGVQAPAGAGVGKGGADKDAVRHGNGSGNVVKEEVQIVPEIAYNLKICGVPVTSINREQLHLCIPGITKGTVKYDPDKRTLTLDGATIDAGDGHCIFSSIDNLKIKVLNSNTLKNNGGSSTVSLSKSAIITGGGSISMTNSSASTGATAIYTHKNLSISDCTVHAESTGSAIAGYLEKNPTLSIRNATVTAKGAGKGTIVNFAKLELDGSVISAPVGARFVASQNAVCALDEGNPIIEEEVRIVPGTAYDLWVCGVQVTSLNKGELTAIHGLNGCTVEGKTVKYNPDNTTLTLEGATLSSGGRATIFSKVADLRIHLAGESSASNGSGNPTLDFEANGTIEGDGTLSIANSRGPGIYVSRCDALQISGCTLTVVAKSAGIAGRLEDKVTLTIRHATVSATGSGSITGFEELVLDGSVISAPLGAHFVARQNAVCDLAEDDPIVKDEVKIEPGTAYHLWVCGVQVTNLNKDNLTVINGVDGCTVTGGVSYNPDTRTLRLEEATIVKTVGADAISVLDGGVTIEVMGTNTVTSNVGSAIVFDNFKGGAPGAIEGGGTLNVTSNDVAIEAFVPLTIRNCTVGTIGELTGIYSEAPLTIHNATVSATGTNGGSIRARKDLKLLNCMISQPADAVYDFSRKAVCDASGLVKGVVKIVPTHDLWVCGVRVNDANKDDLIAVNGKNGCTVTGKVKYDPATTTLTLDGASIDAGDNYCIRSEIDNLKIEVINGNTLTNRSASSAVSLAKSGTITGGGSLSATNSSDNGSALFAEQALTISGCTLSAVGGSSGIVGLKDKSTLTIDNATVTAKGLGKGSIREFKSITLAGVGVKTPAGAGVGKGSAESHSVRLGNGLGDVVKEEVQIVPETAYHLSICGVPVTNINREQLHLYIPGITGGTASYDPATTTLALDGVTIESADKTTIHSEIEGLTVVVKNTNTVKHTNGNSAFYTNKATTITGGGTLSLESSNIALFASDSELTIEGCTVHAEGASYGITGNKGSTEVLTIRNATVTARGKGKGSIADFAAVRLDGTVISAPHGARFVASKGAVCGLSGFDTFIAREEVRIEPGVAYALSVLGVRVTSVNRANLTVLNGAGGGVVKGAVSYDPDTHTLTLADAHIHAGALSYGIVSHEGGEGLTIEVKGASRVESDGYYPIRLLASTTITGGGTLDVTNHRATSDAIFAYGASLTVEGCTLRATAGRSAIRGSARADRLGTLTIRNATVEAMAPGDGSIRGFSDIILTDVAILTPSDAGVGMGAASSYAVRHDGGVGEVVKDSVRIAIAHTVTFESAGGSAVESVKVGHGDRLARPSIPEKEGYTFAGWYADAELHEAYDFEAAVVGGFTLYAKWAVNSYSVTFDGNGATDGNMEKQSFTYDEPQQLTANAYTRTGYTFAGWAETAEGEVKYADNQEVKNLTAESGGVVTLFAVWAAHAYTVKFNGNGGEGNMESQSFTYDVAQPLTANAYSRTGYTFAGWAETPEGEVKYADNQEVVNLTAESGGIVTLYAVWEVNSYSVTYDAPANGTLEVKDETGGIVESGAKVKEGTVLTITATPNAGYELKSLIVNGEKYTSGATYTVNGDVKIVAEFVQSKDGGDTPVEDSALHLTLFPNPASSQIAIDGLVSSARFTIYSSVGGVALSGEVYPGESIDVGGLSAGVYVLHVEGVSLRFVKE